MHKGGDPPALGPLEASLPSVSPERRRVELSTSGLLVAENYVDAEEVPVPGTPSPSQGSEEEVPPEKEDGVRSFQTGEWGQFIPCNLSI